MALEQRRAEVRMEEGYMNLSIYYSKKEDRAIICDAIGDIEHELDVYPEVTHKRDENGGVFSIEFSQEVYVHSRTPGEFVKKVLDKLNIDKCEEVIV